MYRMIRHLKPACLGLLAALLLGVSWLSAAPESYYKLSGDGPLPIGGDVNEFQISADGQYVVYIAGQDVSDLPQLYAARMDGSHPPVKLSALPQQGQYIDDFAISADNAHAVYSADQNTQGISELYSAALDGSADPIKLSGEMVEGGGLPMYGGGFKISPDGDRVIYRADQEILDVFELYSVPVDGSAPEVKLNSLLLEGAGAYDFQITPDSQHVLYTSDQETDNVVELFRVPIEGGAAPEKLNSDLVAGGAISYFKISPDSAWVVYLADGDTNDVSELYRAPVTGDAPVIKLNGALVAGGSVGFAGTFYISPDSQRVIYLADQETNNVDELYSVAMTGGTVTKLNPPLVAEGDVSWVWDAQISGDNSRVVYVANQENKDVQEIFSVPLTGGTATKLNGPLMGEYLYDFAISPDSSRVVYRAQQDSATRYELYSVPLAGGMPIKLNGTLYSGGQVNSFLISSDSSRVVFMADQGTTSGNEIYRVPLAGGSLTKVNGGLTPGGQVFRYDIAANSSRVVYIADQDTSNVNEIYRAPLASPGPVAKLNTTLGIGADIWTYEITDNSRYVLYLADQTRLDRNDLYRARLDGSDDPVRLSQGLAGDYYMYDLEVTPDSSWAIITVDANSEPDSLYSVPVEGGGPPMLLNETAVANARLHYFRLSDDSQYVVYRAEEDTSGVWEIYSAPTDGSGAQVKLNGALVANGVVENFQISPDSSRVVYTADQQTDEVGGLYSVPIGGGAGMKLNALLPPGGNVEEGSFRISPDGTRVAYLADQDTDEVTELYLAPVDGGAPPVKLNAPLVAGGGVLWFQFSPDSSALTYYADQEVDDRYEIYSLRLDGGGGGPVKVNGPLPPDTDVYDFRYSPDGAYMVYQTAQEMGEQYEIYSVPLSAGLPDGSPVKLNDPLGPDEALYDFDFSPDGSYLLYIIYGGMGEGGTLYSVLPDDSGEPQRVTDPEFDGQIGGYWVTSDSSQVIFSLYTSEGEQGIYRAAADGSGTDIKLNGPLVENGRIERFNLSPDDSRVVYQADQDIDDVQELYAATLPEKPVEPELKLYLPVAIR